jgi:hypothetical protein
MDIDVSLPLACLNDFFAPLEQGLADVVIAKRAGKRPFPRRVLSWCMRFATIDLLHNNSSYTRIPDRMRVL